MKVCFLCNEYPPTRHGGIGIATRTLAQSLVEAGHEARVIGFYPQDEPAPEHETDNGVVVTRLKCDSRRFGWIRARRRLYHAVADLAKAGLIDIVEAPDYQGLLAGWPKLPVPAIVRMHGSSSYFAVEMGQRPERLTFRLERASLRRADFLCSTSRYTAEQSKKIFSLPGAEAFVVYNSTVMLAEKPAGPRQPGKVVFSGTLTPKKGVISLVRAWGKVVKECPNAVLHMFGKAGLTNNGVSMQDYLVSCLSNETRDTVRFLGHVTATELKENLRTATVAIFPSYSEAFALAPMEAMAEACPTIYTRRSSGTELIEDGKNGLLIDPDDVDGIAAAIVRVLKDANLAKALGDAGRETIELRFTPDGMIARNVNFFSDCVRAFKDRDSGRRPLVAEFQGTKPE